MQMLLQQEVNDCILASVANYVSLKTGTDAIDVYENLKTLIKDPRTLSATDYMAWVDGHGMPLELISLLVAHYGIWLTSKMARSLPDEPCIIVMPVDHLKEYKYNCHVILWTGTEIHDPIQFDSLRTTHADLLDHLPRVVIYSE